MSLKYLDRQLIYSVAEELIRILKSFDLEFNLGYLTSGLSNQSLFKVSILGEIEHYLQYVAFWIVRFFIRRRLWRWVQFYTFHGARHRFIVCSRIVSWQNAVDVTWIVVFCLCFKSCIFLQCCSDCLIPCYREEWWNSRTNMDHRFVKSIRDSCDFQRFYPHSVLFLLQFQASNLAKLYWVKW